MLQPGFCSRGAQVPQAANFCLWVAGKTYFFQISFGAGHPGFHAQEPFGFS